jgi:oligopeptide transport system substrate-binding protein
MVGRLLSVLIFSGLLSSVLSGRHGFEQLRNPVPKPKVFRMSMGAAPNSFDPVKAGNIFSTPVITAVMQTLYTYAPYKDEPYEVIPNLAACPIKMLNPTTARIELKKGILFQKDECFGKAMTREVVASDFVYSIMRHFDPKNLSISKWVLEGRILGLDAWGKNLKRSYSDPIEGLRALDKHTVEIKLTKPFPQLLHTLTMAFSVVVPQEAVEKYGVGFATRPVGSGPWRLKTFNSKKTELVPSDVYKKQPINIYQLGYDPVRHKDFDLLAIHGKLAPMLDKIVIHYMMSGVAWSALMKQNELDYCVVSEKFAVKMLDGEGKLRPEHAARFNYVALSPLEVNYLEFNMYDPTFGRVNDPVQNQRNRALRQAIRKAYNWGAKKKFRFLGQGEIFPGVIPPTLEGFDPMMGRESITYDPTGAKALLKKFGWTAENLPVLEYPGVNNMHFQQDFEQFRAWMGKIGYPKKKIRPKTFSNFGEYWHQIRTKKLAFHADILWKLDFPDAINFLQLFADPESCIPLLIMCLRKRQVCLRA